MSRPIYETQADLDNEAKVRKFLSSEWECRFIKLNPIKWKVDFLVQRGNQYSWAELKCPKMNYGDYPFMISYKKIEAAKLLHDTSKKKFNLIYKCNDLLCFHTWDFNKEYPFEYGGRTVNTRDPQDIEPVFLIDPKDCTIVEGFSA